jgi:nascent polypeptide-associated complex subunit alpha
VPREVKIPEDDIKLVMEQTKSNDADAKNALIETKGDIAAAIMKLTKT